MSNPSLNRTLDGLLQASATTATSGEGDVPMFTTGTSLLADAAQEAVGNDLFDYEPTPPVRAFVGAGEVVSDEGTRWVSKSTALAELVVQRLRNASLVIVSRSTYDHSDMEPAAILQSLKRELGVNSTELAKALGVSRRALYNWIGGQISDENKYKLSEAYAALRPLVERRRPGQVRSWLSSADTSWSLLKENSISDLIDRVNEALVEPEIPLFRAHPIVDDRPDAPGSRVGPLSDEHRRQVLRRFASTPEESLAAEWNPPELTDSLEQDDE